MNESMMERVPPHNHEAEQSVIGAIFLGIVACLPIVLGIFSAKLSALAFGGSSLLILVSVVIETQREIEAQMTMRHYKGFLE